MKEPATGDRQSSAAPAQAWIDPFAADTSDRNWTPREVDSPIRNASARLLALFHRMWRK